MPRITLLAVPPGYRAVVDPVSGLRLTPGQAAEVDDATVARLRSTEPIGNRFEVTQEDTPTNEPAADGPASPPTAPSAQ